MKLATLCYVQKDNQTLMLHRVGRDGDIHKEKYVGLGGKLEYKLEESPEECVVREVKEESGLEVKPVLKGMLVIYNNGGRESIQDDYFVFIYIAKEFRGQMKDKIDEGVLEWIDNQNLLNLNMWEGDRLFIIWINEKGIFSG